MSTAKTQLDALITEQAQQARVVEARVKLQNCYWTIQETNSSIHALVDAGALDLISAELKLALNKIWTAMKTCQASIEALAEKDLLDNS
jgi:hypothetical protein